MIPGTDPILSLKIQGQQSNSTAIATVAITFNSDGTWAFTGPGGDAFVYNGQSGVINRLFQMIFTGTGGLASTQAPGIMA